MRSCGPSLTVSSTETGYGAQPPRRAAGTGLDRGVDGRLLGGLQPEAARLSLITIGWDGLGPLQAGDVVDATVDRAAGAADRLAH